MKNKKRRFFLYCHIMSPHEPYLKKPEEEEFLAGKDSTLIKSVREKFENKKNTKTDNWTEEELEILAGFFDSNLKQADSWVGRLFTTLEDLELENKTLVIISSDHGENQGELQVFGDHATACHIVNRVPMIIKWPKKKWKRQYDSLIYATDIAATLIEGVGKKVPKFWDGKSIYNEIENGEEFGRNYLVISQNAWTCQRAVRFGNWTLIRTYHTGLIKYPEIMLYDFENDFHMTNDLAAVRPEIVGKGLQLLEEWYTQMIKSSPSTKDPMWTVIEEGGPFHVRERITAYLKRTKRSDREEIFKAIQRIKEYENIELL